MDVSIPGYWCKMRKRLITVVAFILFIAVLIPMRAKAADPTYDLTYITVSFNGNGAMGSMSSISVVRDSAFVLPSCMYSNPGFEFYGWEDTETGNIYAQDELALASTSGAEKTYSAVWYPSGGTYSGTPKTSVSLAVIGSAAVNGLVLPEVGATGCTASQLSAAVGSNCTVEGVFWYEGSSTTPLTGSWTFEADKSYHCDIVLKAYDIFYFLNTPTGTVNGGDFTCTSFNALSSLSYAVMRVEFGTLPYSFVNVFDGTADKLRASVGETVTLTASDTGDEFRHWAVITDDGIVSVEHSGNSSTTFIMPGKNVYAVAVRKGYSQVTKTVSFETPVNTDCSFEYPFSELFPSATDCRLIAAVDGNPDFYSVDCIAWTPTANFYKIGCDGIPNEAKTVQHFYVFLVDGQEAVVEMTLRVYVTQTVMFDTNDIGSTVPSQTVEFGKKVEKPADPTAEGYVFDKWVNELNNEWNFAVNTVDRDVTLIAKWLRILTADVASDIPEQTFTGSAITPELSVAVGGRTLTKDTDYELSFENNVEVGTATVTVTGKGNYTGSFDVNFIIAEPEVPQTGDSSLFTVLAVGLVSLCGYALFRKKRVAE